MLKKISSLDDLLFFVTLVEEGSFTKAAQKLNMTKSKLSRHLVALEAKLGCELLLRTTRKQVLTENGRELFLASKQHIQALTQVEEAFSLSLNQLQGRINILLPLEFFNHVFSRLIADFLTLHPDIEIHCQHYSSLIPAFDPHFDLCLVVHEQDLPNTNWIGKELLSFPQSIYKSKQFCHEFNTLLEPIPLSKLSAFECILAQDEQVWFFRQEQATEALFVQGRAMFASPQMRLLACTQGLGLCKLPDYIVVQGQQADNLEKLKLAQDPIAQRLTVLYQSRNVAVKVRTFLDYLQSHIAKLL